MLDVSPTNLLMEVTSAEKCRDEHLQSLEQQVKRFHGPAWKGSFKWSDLDYDPKNRGFQFIARFLPEVAGKNPRFSMRSKRGPAQRMIAEAMRHGMNRWARDTNVKATVEQVATDAQFTYGVLCVIQAPTPMSDQGPREPSMRPQMYRKSQKEFGMDALAKDPREARFMFHVFVIDKEDLEERAEEKKDEGWRLDVIKGLASDTGIEKLNRNKSYESAGRSELVGYSIWVPEHELPFGEAEKKKYGKDSWRAAGFNGTIFTLAVGQSVTGDSDGQEIRDPQPYYGPPSGPYQIIGMYYVPDSPTPLGTLTAVEAQNQELNTHARAYLRSAARRKKIGIVGANDTLLREAVKNAEDGAVVTANVADIRANFIEAEMGGPTAEQRLSILDLESNLDNALGTSDATRGTVTGIATASENMIAAQSSGTRIGWNRTKFDSQFNEACKKVAWYLYHDDRVTFPLGEEAAQELKIDDPWFQGGTHEDGSGFTFDDLELEIEANSMALVDEMQQRERVLQAMGIVTGWFPLMLQFPGAGWEAMVSEVGEGFGIPDLAAMVKVKGVIASGLAMMAAMSGQGAPQGDQGGQAEPTTPMELPSPRLAGDSGLGRSMKGGMSSGIQNANRMPPPNKNRASLGAQASKQAKPVGAGY